MEKGKFKNVGIIYIDIDYQVPSRNGQLQVSKELKEALKVMGNGVKPVKVYLNKA